MDSEKFEISFTQVLLNATVCSEEISDQGPCLLCTGIAKLLTKFVYTWNQHMQIKLRVSVLTAAGWCFDVT